MTGGIDYDYEDRHRDARVPEPGFTRRSGFRRIGTILTGLFTICLLLAFGVGGGFVYLHSAFDRVGPLETEKTVLINRGDGSRVISEKLHREGVVSDDRVFLFGLFAHQANGKLKAGEYRFDAHVTMREIMEKLVAGKSVQYRITLPEGLTSHQVVERVMDNEILVGELETDIPEGSLLPDTYHFTRGTTRQEVIERMQAAQSKLLTDLWPSRSPDLPVANPTEAIILASIVEKETGLATERRRVAGVFVNRLKRSMRLQSDPTIVYGLVGGKGALGRPISKADISQRTEYNTYQIDGLPPTPIANPGRAAIEAVLNPAETRDLYFVADGTGGHAFAETLTEHSANVNRWRDLERRKNQPESAETSVTPVRDDGAANQTAALQPPPDPDAADTFSQSETLSDATDEPPAADSEPVADDSADADLEPDENATESASLQDEEPAEDDEPAGDDADVTADDGLDQAADDDAGGDADLENETEEAAAPEAEERTEAAQEPEPVPEPEERPSLSEIAKAIIESSPSPKPKPDLPEGQVSVTEPVPEPDDADAAQAPNEPLPIAPDVNAPALLPETPQQPVAPSAGDLR